MTARSLIIILLIALATGKADAFLTSTKPLAPVAGSIAVATPAGQAGNNLSQGITLRGAAANGNGLNPALPNAKNVQSPDRHMTPAEMLSKPVSIWLDLFIALMLANTGLNWAFKIKG